MDRIEHRIEYSCWKKKEYRYASFTIWFWYDTNPVWLKSKSVHVRFNQNQLVDLNTRINGESVSVAV